MDIRYIVWKVLLACHKLLDIRKKNYNILNDKTVIKEHPDL